jgi:hypothetical protein
MPDSLTPPLCRVNKKDGPRSSRSSEEFRRWLADAEQSANDLGKLLRRGPGKEAETAAEQVFGKIAASCNRCHAKYRDVPPPP